MPGLVDRGMWGENRGSKRPITSLPVARVTDAPPSNGGLMCMCFEKHLLLFKFFFIGRGISEHFKIKQICIHVLTGVELAEMV